jgi:hypothetical protein
MDIILKHDLLRRVLEANCRQPAPISMARYSTAGEVKIGSFALDSQT